MARTWTREDAAGEKVTRERIDQSLNIAGSVLDATVEINDTTIRDEVLADELDAARTAVARARELVLPEPAQSYRFRIDWWTTILDKDAGASYPIRGYTVIEADGITEARDRADSLCDAEFFAPYQITNSAHGDDVVGGHMWQENVNYEGSGHQPHLRYGPHLGHVLPDVETWDFEDIKILAVRELS